MAGRQGAIAAATALAGSMLLASAALAETRGLSVELRASEAAGAPVSETVRLYSKSYALVIGIDRYRNRAWGRLSKAVSDAKRVRRALEERGFEVTFKTDLDGARLELAFRDFFIKKGRDAEARLFVWYAGHGYTLDGEGYLIPADGASPDDEVAFLETALSLRDFGKYVRYAKSKHVFTVFDSCFAGTIFNVARSRTPPAITRLTTEPVRQFLSSGDAGQVVSDDGEFARLFSEALAGRSRADANADGYLTASEIGAYLTYEVSNATNNQQTPRYGKLRSSRFRKGDFVFALAKAAAPVSTVAVPSPSAGGFSLDDLEKEQETRAGWEVWQSSMRAAFRAAQAFTGAADLKRVAWDRFLSAFAEDNPHSSEDEALRAEARRRRAAVEVAIVSPPRPPVPPAAEKAVGVFPKTFKTCADCPEMVVIPAGRFRMGSTEAETTRENVPDRYAKRERPRHGVTVGRFAFGKYEVTFAEYDTCVAAGGCGWRPGEVVPHCWTGWQRS